MRGNIVGDKYIKREKESEMLRMGGGSWTINLGWVGTTIKEVVYITERATYKIKLDNAMANGFERQFQGERKLVVPLKHWTITEEEAPNRDREVSTTIMRYWNEGLKEEARRYWRDNKKFLSEKVERFFKTRLGIEPVPEVLIKAQEIMGGKIIDQYGEEYKKDKAQSEVGERNPKGSDGLPGIQESIFLETK